MAKKKPVLEPVQAAEDAGKIVQRFINHMGFLMFPDATGTCYEKTGMQVQFKNKRKINIGITVEIDDSFKNDIAPLPCPSCGKKPVKTYTESDGNVVLCMGCSIKTFDNYVGKAVNKWNQMVERVHSRCESGELAEDNPS